MAIKVGVIGATGYVGIELVRLLQQHSQVEITYLATESYNGQNIAKVYPHLKNIIDQEIAELNIEAIKAKCDVIFLALPHGKSAAIAALLSDKKIIDLSSDFRLRNPGSYQNWYQYDHPPLDLLEKAVYGLPELGYRAQLKNASLVANPGCYPTAVLIAATPALKLGIVEVNECIFDAKSGVSGAGRGASLTNHFCEVTENLIPYKLTSHRHIAEIEQELSLVAKEEIAVQFSPHLTPMIRGLVATCYFKLKKTISQKEAHEAYSEFYQNEQFIRISALEQIPQAKQVRGTNYCDIGIYLDSRTQRLIIISVIDNLIKGASGQAVQNMNLMCNLDEAMGLEGAAIYP